MTAMLWDISPSVSDTTPVWPGDSPYRQEVTWSMSDQCPVLVHKISLSPHVGAHADAPSHYRQGGLPIGMVALEPYIGPCRVVDATAAGALVTLEIVRELLQPPFPPRVVFKTRQEDYVETWNENFCAIDPALIDFLHDNQVLLIGIDTPSIDPQDSKTLDAHQRVSQHDMRILESLALDRVPPGDYELIALPLKWIQADASPVRAILRSL